MKVLWQCEGCGIQAVRVDDELEYHLPYNAIAQQWYHKPRYDEKTPGIEPAFTFEPESPVCEFCLEKCEDCETPVSSRLEYGDVYDHGFCVLKDKDDFTSHDVICIECLEKRPNEDE